MVVVDDDDDEECSTIVAVEGGWFESRRGLCDVNALMVDISWIRRMMERILLDDFIVCFLRNSLHDTLNNTTIGTISPPS